MPSNTGSLRLVQWPLFLLSSKVKPGKLFLAYLIGNQLLLSCSFCFEVHYFLQILLAIDLALDCKDTQADLWSRICKDEYMAYAVQEVYYSIEKILHALVDGEGRLWYAFFFSPFPFMLSKQQLLFRLVPSNRSYTFLVVVDVL